MKNDNKKEQEIEIASKFLQYSMEPIALSYVALCSLYHGYRFKDKNIRDKIRALRRSFYHDGKPHQIKKFEEAHRSLKLYIKSIE